MKAMLNIKKAPHGLLLLTAIVLLLAFVFSPFANIDFEGKTMFSFPVATMTWIIPLLLIFFWLLYVLTNRFLYSMTLTRIHVLFTVFATILIAAVLYIVIMPSQLPAGSHELIGNTVQILSILFVIGQLIYLANVLLGLLGRR